MRFRFHNLAAIVLMAGGIAVLDTGRLVTVAQESQPPDKKIIKLDGKIESQEEQLIKNRERQNSIFRELQVLDNIISLHRRKESELRKTIEKINVQMEANRKEEERMNGIMDVQRRMLGRRFRAMYMDGPTGFMELMLSSESFTDLSRRDKYYRSMVKADGKLIDEYRRNLKVLRDVQNKLELDRRRTVTLKNEIEATRRGLEKRRNAKASLIRAAHEDKDTHLRVVAERKATSARVAGVIARTERRREEARRRAEEAQGTAPPATGLDIAPIVPRMPVPEEAQGGFAAQKGRMCAPSVGPVVQQYGVLTNPRFGTRTYSKGIAIAAPYGAPIRAAWNGEVVYSGWFGGYGKIIIVSHGDHYYTLYAHASALLKGTGSRVKKGETIARVGDTGSLEGPRVYFEVRQGSNSMNPLSWVRVGC